MLDQRRNELRAAMDDRDIKKVADSEDEQRRLGMSPVYAKSRWEKRESRRAWERKMCLAPIPPGPWSLDLDEYHDAKGYNIDLGDGYTGQIHRNGEGTYNGYVTVPDGHPCAGLGYDIFDYDSSLKIPQPPQEMTFGNGRQFGFDQCHSWNVKPVPSRLYYDSNYYDCNAPTVGCGYIDYFGTRKQVMALYEYFKTLEADHTETILKWRTARGRGHRNVAALTERQQKIAAEKSPSPVAAPAAATVPAVATVHAAVTTASTVPAVAKRSWAAVVKNQ